MESSGLCRCINLLARICPQKSYANVVSPTILYSLLLGILGTTLDKICFCSLSYGRAGNVMWTHVEFCGLQAELHFLIREKRFQYFAIYIQVVENKEYLLYNKDL